MSEPTAAGGPGGAALADNPESAWRHALFLHERAVPDASALPAGALAAAEEAAREWARESGADEATFAYRLASAGLDRDGFVRVLAAREAGLAPKAREADALDWVEAIGEVARGTHAGVALPPMEWRSPDGSVGTEPPFSAFIGPFLRLAVGRFREGLAAVEARLAAREPLFGGRVETQLVLYLVERLVKHCSGTLILELNVARLRGLLRGDTPAERFRHFSEEFFTPESVVGLLREYPVLARLMSVTAARWVETSLEFLARLAADRDQLGELTGGAGRGTLREVRVGVSDPHRGGRSVIIAEDAHGQKVVYKPVPLAADARFEALVRAMNGFGPRHAHRAARVIDRGGYGWIEHVEAAGCASDAELRRFYWRQGSLAALLHVVRGADFHHENLLACGEHPVLVDNEGIFHHGRPADAAPPTAHREAADVLRRSVLRQAFLPFVFRFTPGARGIDNSGLGGAGGQVAEGAVRRWADPATDTMRVERADLVTTEAKNLPSLDGETVDATRYLAEIVQGFAETYDLVSAHRGEVAALLEAFAGAPVRHLVRATRQYGVFLREGNHPNDLRDGLDRDALLDHLWAQGNLHPLYRPAVEAEAADLRTGDVPAFYARPESVHLWDGRGRRIDGFFAESSLAEAHRQLRAMSAGDRDRQLLLIRLTVSEARSRAGAPEIAVNHQPRLHDGDGDGDGDAAALEAAAVRVGEALKVRAIAGKHGACWIGVDPFVPDSPAGDRPRNVALARGDLYHGSAGIALFLAHLGSATGRGDFTGLARGAVQGVREAMAFEGAAANHAVGAYLGRASYSYALQHLAALWGDPSLLDAALADLPGIEAAIPADGELDLLAGSAGCALVTLQLHEATGDAAALRAARACGDHLLANAQPAHGGVGWTGQTFASPVPGLSHGAAGIARALFALADATGDERYRDAALKAVAFERNLLASPEGAPFHARAGWCHGPPSVAFGRILAARWHDDAFVRGEVEAGAARLLGAGAPADACLCHGALGNAEVLAAAGRHLGVEEWERAARGWALGVAAGVEWPERDPYLPLHARFAGVMSGLAGIGLGLLRFARPAEVPSVLALEPPMRGQS